MFSTDLSVDINTMSLLPLEHFKRIKQNVWNCKCYHCGDSKTRKNVNRMFFHVKKGQLFVCCKNCGYSRSFYNFMSDHFPNMFDDYKKQTLMQFIKSNNAAEPSVLHSKHTPSVVASPNIEVAHNAVDLVIDLPLYHPVRQYLESRCITGELLNRFWYADNFYKLAVLVDNSLQDADENKIKCMSHPRLIIPFFSKDGKTIEVIQGRSLKKEDKLRYITIKSSEDVDKIYGKNEINYNEPVRVVEGPIDSIFVRNCLAVCDADLTKVEADCYIWDNQCRNKEVVMHMEHAIALGKSVMIWPNSTDQKQDINDLIKQGIPVSLLNEIIEMRTFKGIRATMELTKWRRV